MEASDNVPLREYVEAMFAEREKAVEAALAAQEKAVTAALEASDKAISKAEANADKWRENANEWRGAMSDRDRELPSRREVEQTTASLADRITKLETAATNTGGRQEGLNAFWGYLVGGVGVLAAVAAILTNT